VREEVEGLYGNLGSGFLLFLLHATPMASWVNWVNKHRKATKKGLLTSLSTTYNEVRMTSMDFTIQNGSLVMMIHFDLIPCYGDPVCLWEGWQCWKHSFMH
jgi:hypothetical protein